MRNDESVHHLRFEQMFYSPRMGRLGYPNSTVVSATLERPFRGRIVLPEHGKSGQILLECDHDHPSIPEAFQCAGQEIGRNGLT